MGDVVKEVIWLTPALSCPMFVTWRHWNSNQGEIMSIEASRLKPENTAKQSSSNQVCQRLLIVLFATAMVLPNSGCSLGQRLGSLGIGDALLETYRDQVWAKRAFNLRYNNCNIPYESHFQNGFVAGYCDTCNGGDGYVPALPPDEYRGFEFQSPDGAQCVKTWFEGFPAGVAAAKKDRAGEFHEIYTSRMINAAITQEKAKHILPSDVPVLSTNDYGVAQRTDPPKNSTAALDNGIVGTNSPTNLQNRDYVAPPATSNGALLSPKSLTPSDLVKSPTIRKSGPGAMAPVSKMQQFTIDPAVKVQPSIASTSAAPIATVDQSLAPVVQQPVPILRATLPPIISTARSQQIVAQPTATPAVTQAVTMPIPVQSAAQSQTPLPMAVRSAGNGWRSQTSSRRR